MEYVRIIVMAAFMAAAIRSDCRERKIYNKLILLMGAAGLLIGLLMGGLPGLLAGCVGLLVGFLIGFLLWCLSVFRAGDAKLLAGIGAMMGWRWVVDCLLWSVVSGAVIGIVFLAVKGEVVARMKRLWTYFKLLILTRSYQPYASAEEKGELPFAICLALGGVLTCIWPIFG